MLPFVRKSHENHICHCLPYLSKCQWRLRPIVFGNANLIVSWVEKVGTWKQLLYQMLKGTKDLNCCRIDTCWLSERFLYCSSLKVFHSSSLNERIQSSSVRKTFMVSWNVLLFTPKSCGSLWPGLWWSHWACNFHTAVPGRMHRPWERWSESEPQKLGEKPKCWTLKRICRHFCC